MSVRDHGGEDARRGGSPFGRQRALRELLVAAADAARHGRHALGMEADAAPAADSPRRRLALLLLATD